MAKYRNSSDLPKGLLTKLEERVRDNPSMEDGQLGCFRYGGKKIRVPVGIVREVRSTITPKEESRGSDDASVDGVKGFHLTPSNVYNQAPTDRVKGLLFSLPKGRGFAVSEMSKKWRMSEDTLRRHARKHDALRYVENEPGVYVACVMHPETADKYKG